MSYPLAVSGSSWYNAFRMEFLAALWESLNSTCSLFQPGRRVDYSLWRWPTFMYSVFHMRGECASQDSMSAGHKGKALLLNVCEEGSNANTAQHATLFIHPFLSEHLLIYLNQVPVCFYNARWYTARVLNITRFVYLAQPDWLPHRFTCDRFMVVCWVGIITL